MKTRKPDVPLEEFVSKGMAAQRAADAEIAKHTELDRIETADARKMIEQLKAKLMLDALSKQQLDSQEGIQIVKRWLKKHWSDGWRAAGGPSGAPEQAPAKAGKAKR